MNSASRNQATTAHGGHFPLLEVRGGPRERGHAHGEHFRARIVDTFNFYLDDLFSTAAIGRSDIIARAAQIDPLTRRFAPALADEIEAIAQGCGLQPWKLFLLNARTEILNARVDECSAVYFAETRILAQNWDWVEELEDLCVVIRHEHADGHRHLSFAEPGMVAKIGMNSAGIGVCLNILFAAHGLSGLPVHILIGALLNARDFAAARSILESCGLGKASHLLVADAHGNAVSMEYFGDQKYALEARDGVLLHTNHCLGLGAAGRSLELANSCKRYDLLGARTSATEARDVETVKAILLSADGGINSLMRPYRDETVLGNHRVGTCASLIMELAEGRMHVRRGPGNTDTFVELAA